jgi:hypothetical protein
MTPEHTDEGDRVIHLLLQSQEGRWARDPDGRTWIQRRREESDPQCSACDTAYHPTVVGQHVWVTRTGFDAFGKIYLRAVCPAHADVQHPIPGGRSA